MEDHIRVGFLGAGKFARAHAYALDALKHYYPETPTIEKVVAASPTPQSREGFAETYGFSEAIPPEQIWDRDDFDTLFIVGANHTHAPQLINAAAMPTLKRIYVEKPVGTKLQDIRDLEALDRSNHGKFIMIGFQFLQKSPVRKALAHWRSGVFGEPVHFSAEYLHSSYLDPEYRQKRQNRLKPIPLDGAAVDIGSHPLSMLTAFLGNSLLVRSAYDYNKIAGETLNSDLCTIAILEEPESTAIGTFTASRVSAGAGDQMTLEIRGTRGAILFDTSQPDIYKSYLPESGWRVHHVMSDYTPASTFPSGYMPTGWLRALVHNHFLFLGGEPGISVIPDLAHGIQVQRLLQQIAEHLITE